MSIDDSKFGKYEIDAKLGAGGMAEVFRCRLAGLGGFEKLVVVKRILAHHAKDPHFVEMFMDEARLAANLNHPNIVQTFEIDEIAGIAYIAMEYVKGPTLSQLMRAAWRENKVHVGHLALIVSQVCEGLDYAHNAVDASGEPMHIIHRDVSPQNVIVSLGGVPKLLDFGVAKGRGRLAKTEAGTLKGKLRYMAPEQVMQIGTISQKADVYSAGVVLYEATTGENPYGGADSSDVTVLKNVVDGTMKKPSEVIPDYPPELEKIVLGALERDPDKRCASARELHDQLEVFVSSGPYASSQRAVAAWVNELFPNFEVTAYRNNERTPGTTPARHSKGGSLRPMPRYDAGTELDLGEREPRPRRWPAVAMVAVLALLLIGYLGVRAYRKSEPPEAVVTAPPPTEAIGTRETPSSVSPDEAAKAYLDEAERLAKARRFNLALQMVKKARGFKVEDPLVDIRLSQVLDSVEMQALLYKANNMLERGDVDPALDLAKQVMERDPTNAEALKLIAAARHSRESKKQAVAPPVEKKKEREKEAPGLLTVSSTPNGMVYLDDEPIGRTPIKGKSIPAGLHTIQIRESGYNPAETTTRVDAGKKLTLALTLHQKEKKSEPLVLNDEPAEESDPLPAKLSPPVTSPPTSPAAQVQSQTAPPANAPPPAASSPAASAVARAPVVSVKPRSPIQQPHLPKTYNARDVDEITRVFRIIENEAVAQAGITPEFARGITDSVRNAISGQGGSQIYPVAMYYMIVREAARGVDNRAAAENLVSMVRSGAVMKFKDLPSIDRAL